MSTILDSLKKSSDNRDGEQKTSIDSFNFARDKQPSGFRSLVIILLLLIITAIVVYYGYQYLYADKTAETTVVEGNDFAEIGTGIQERIDEKTANQSQDKIQKPDSDNVLKKIKEIKSNRENKKQTLGDLNRPSSSNQAGKVASPVLDKKPENTQEPLLTLTMPKEKKPQQLNNGVAKQDYLYLYQLPFSIRKDIPKIKLNIHVYDDNSEDRIAIMNGVRYKIGDLIENEVVVKDIVKNGVVLEFNEHEFLVSNL